MVISWPMKWVVRSPATKAGWSRIERWRGIVVGTPSTIISLRARFMRAIASLRSLPQVTTFAIIESYWSGMR
ncbi:hypothetical protein D3C86_2084090 [compost metagenome]